MTARWQGLNSDFGLERRAARRGGSDIQEDGIWRRSPAHPLQVKYGNRDGGGEGYTYLGHPPLNLPCVGSKNLLQKTHKHGFFLDKIPYTSRPLW